MLTPVGIWQAFSAYPPHDIDPYSPHMSDEGMNVMIEVHLWEIVLERGIKET